MDAEKIIEQWFHILTELDARERSNNCVISCLQSFSWNELCGMATKLFEQLKE